MKKNKFMRLASGLLVGTLLTTCAISGTFAKYTTQDAAEDSARVAKWGVELQIIGDLYSDSYKDESTAYVQGEEGASIRVQAADPNANATDKTNNLVAPGTKDLTGLTIKLNGTPEVDSEMLVEMEIENIFLNAGTYGLMVKVEDAGADGLITADNYEDLYTTQPFYTLEGSNYVKASSTTFDAAKVYYTFEDVIAVDDVYYPVVYNLTGGGLQTAYTNANDTMNDTLKLIADSIESKLTGAAATGTQDAADLSKYTYSFKSKLYDTNTDLGDATQLSNVNLNWDWNFTDVPQVDGDDVNTADIDDGADTILGNLMAFGTEAQANGTQVVKLDGNQYVKLVNGSDYNLETSFMLDITVNQVD